MNVSLEDIDKLGYRYLTNALTDQDVRCLCEAQAIVNVGGSMEEERTPDETIWGCERGEWVRYTDLTGTAYQAQVSKVVNRESGIVHLMVETPAGNRRIEFVDHDGTGKFHTWRKGD